jgi:lipoprotein NlpD
MPLKRGMSVFISIRSQFRLYSLVLLMLVGVVACKSSSQLAPIEQLGQPPGIKLNHHKVSKGDTLISIAWRYGMDYHQLASINNISAPYTIYVGQKVFLDRGASSSAASNSVEVSPGVEVVAIGDDANAVTVVSETSDATAVKPVASLPAETSVSANSEKQSVNSTLETKSIPVSSTGVQWIWPASGRITSSFSSSDPLRKGVDLDGKQGDPVVATRSGNVVYAGNGLAGYGELVILKHDEQFLSAYGNNSKLLVKEGESIKVGQKIAEIGSSGTDSNKLHFEIRKQGKPVDPLLYLPKR